MNSLINIPFNKDLDQDILDTIVDSKNMNNIIENHPKINFKNSFHPFMEQIQKMFYNEEICGEEILFILKELFLLILNYKNEIQNVRPKLSIKYNELELAKEKYDSVSKIKTKSNQKILNQYTSELNKIKKEIETLDKVYRKIKQELKEKTHSFIDSYVEFDTDINYYNLINGILDSSKLIQSIYYLLTKDHQNILKECYKDTTIKQPIDMFEYISRNFTPSFHIDKNTIVYYWNIDNKSHQKILLNKYDENYFDSFNKLSFNKKANYLVNLIE
jgi:hypothetical protein